MALDAEHVFVWQLHRTMTARFPAMKFHGCINDCLFVTGVEREQIKHVVEHDCGPDEPIPAQKSFCLFWPDDSPRFEDKERLVAAPKVEWSHRYNRPRPSAWRARNAESVDAFDDDVAFGYWSTNAPFKSGVTEWRLMSEPDRKSVV